MAYFLTEAGAVKIEIQMNFLCQTREENMHYEAVARYEREEELIAPFSAAKVNTAVL